MLVKNQYQGETDRMAGHGALCYQIRQAFPHGEVTAEEANRIGYETAMRWTKGKYQFFVCTHIDKEHIHNHIYYNSTAYDRSRKFRNFIGSSFALRRLSDRVCLEHDLSVIVNPKLHSKGRYLHYGQWLGENQKLSQKEQIRSAIDTALTEFNVVGQNALSTLNLVVGIVVAMLVAMVLLGGIKRIGSVSERLVPFMALFYIVLAVGVVILNIQRFPAVIEAIFAGAFNPAAFTGGTIGSLFISMQKGVSRGIFSNEAGLGTGSIAHACADTKKPVKQGMFGIFEVFADTIVICTLTAMVILCSGTTVNYGTAAGAELTISGFTMTYGGWASIFTAVALCCSAFSTIIGWGLYGSRFIAFLCRSDKVVRPFFVVYSFVSILGATMDLGLMWSIAVTFNGLMSIPNLIALLLLSGTVAQLTKEYFEKEKV